jgi:transcriptional regulator with XRE-family HTH domain
MSNIFFSFAMIFLPKISDFIYMEKKGSPIVDRIDSRAAEVGKSRPELTAKANLAKNTFANWAARGTMPPADVAITIADELQCSVRWLITGVNDKQEEYTVEEKDVVGRYRLMDKQGQFEINALLKAKTVPIEKKLAQASKSSDSEEKKQA